jgi:hypothetical protein
MTTLILLIAAAVSGAWLGAGTPKAAAPGPDQDGLALLTAAALFLMTNLGLLHGGPPISADRAWSQG